MPRSLLAALSILGIACFQFFVYPGHTYLLGASQYLVAMMERLAAHGFLSRDLVAVNPVLTYTIYDEVTWFLAHVTHLDWSYVLGAQQLLCRLAGLTGTYLLCHSLHLRRRESLALTALIGFVGVLPGIAVPLNDPEPTPNAFSLGLTLLALGCLAREKPLLASLFGGIALAYDPTLGAVFWFVLLLGSLLQKRLRPFLRPAVPALIVFSLLLGNAAQLQPGQGEAQTALQRISPEWLAVIAERTPEVSPLLWSPLAWVFYIGVGIAGGFALLTSRRQTISHSWIYRSGLLFGLICIAAVAMTLAIGQWAWIAAAEPARALAISVVFGAILCAAAGLRGSRTRQWKRSLFLLPVVLLLVVCRTPRLAASDRRDMPDLDRMADWARQKTWGGSLFYFADAGNSALPGRFRSLSVRAIYVDWASGELVKIFPAFAVEWQARWKVAASPYSLNQLTTDLGLPIDYIVLHKQHALRDIQAEFSSAELLVYDAHSLQNAPKPLRSY